MLDVVGLGSRMIFCLQTAGRQPDRLALFVKPSRERCHLVLVRYELKRPVAHLPLLSSSLEHVSHSSQTFSPRFYHGYERWSEDAQ